MARKKCCIPNCRKLQEDPSVTLHDFPSNPDIAAKWIQNINFFLKNGGTWFPQNDSVICSAHFLRSDFNPSKKKRKTLKRRSIPSLFVYREEKRKQKTVKKPEPKSPLIVKVIKPATSDDEASPTVSPTCSPDSPPSSPVPNSVPTPFKISQVISLPGMNLPSGNVRLLPSNIVTLPQANFDPLHLQKSTITNGQSSVNGANISANIPQFKGSTPLKPSQFVLLPQGFPPPGGYLIFPNGKPLPLPGDGVRILPSSNLTTVNKNVKFNQSPNASLVNNSVTNRSPPINQNKGKPFNDKSENGDLKLSRSATSNPVSNFDDLFCETSSEATKCDDSVIQSNVSRKEVERPQATSFDKQTSALREDGITLKRPSSKSNAEMQSVKKKKVTKEQASDLIEIGPNTFMKINPDIIKVTRKQTPNGNTVLQFAMNPNIVGHDPKKPIFSFTNGDSATDNSTTSESKQTSAENASNVDMHMPDSTSQNEDVVNSNDGMSEPVVVTTTLPLQHTFSNVRMKYGKALKLKSTQICRLNNKIKSLEKKVEELENKCIVQERQLNFASIKKLKTIKKDAERGIPHAAFILEQIRGYFGKNIRVNWSHTTLVQCSIWCRKAPYAYEYFKKDDLFRLPARNTIKRFMQRNPEVRLQIKNKAFSRKRGPEESSSSSDFDSDFDFDESDDENMPPSENADKVSIPVEAILASSPQHIGEDSHSSSGIQFDSPIDNLSPSKSALNSVSIIPNYEAQLSDKEDADSSTVDKNIRSTEARQPLTNIFGKVLCEMAGSVNKNKHDDNISSSALPATGENQFRKSDNEVLSAASNQLIVPTIIESNSQELMSVNDCSNSQELMATGDGSDSQGLMSIDDGSNSQELMATDTCSNHEEMMAVDDFSNNQELMAIDSSNQQKLMTSDEAANSPLLMSSNEASSIEAMTATNDNSNNCYLQTSERDGVTTINIDGQEIVIPEQDGITTINLNGQDIVIPRGTILQLNSDFNADELSTHFLIIPSEEDQH